MHRTFLAINIPVSALMTGCIQDLKKQLNNERIKWVSPSRFHITLKFLGNISSSAIEGINDRLENITGLYQPIHITVSGMGVFRSIHHPRVLWMGINADDSLKGMHKQLEEALQEFGFEKTDKPFHPHLTLGRIKVINNTELLGDLIEKYKTTLFSSVVVNELIFYESILRQTGPEYIVLQKHPLGV